jgi:hypothetical protein
MCDLQQLPATLPCAGAPDTNANSVLSRRRRGRMNLWGLIRRNDRRRSNTKLDVPGHAPIAGNQLVPEVIL